MPPPDDTDPRHTPTGPAPTRRRRPAAPVAHLLALAPLDVWLAMLARAGPVRPVYWPRLAFCLFTSLVGTVVTLPERAALWPVRRARFGGDAPRFDHPPGVIVVLGYYRSGTTHLHNLLACHPGVVTPRWYQCLAGQGWWMSWAVVRFMLTPFLGQTRPQDSVGFGPDWPAEDDFALATWAGASTLAARFVFPHTWPDGSAWHALDDLTPARRRRWRSLTAMFCWKVTRPGRTRVLLLKTPSHTARVAELDRLFAGRVRFVSIERDRDAVIRSNLNMHAALADHAVADPPDDQTLRARIEAELDDTTARRDAQLGAIDPARVVRLRYEDLAADPWTQLGRICPALGLLWDAPAQRRVAAYLHRVGRYQDRPAPANLPPDPEPHAAIPRPATAVATGLAVGLAGAALWLALTWLTNHQWGWRERFDPFAWIIGGVIGAAMARAGRVGSPRLGALAAAVAMAVPLAVSFPITVINWNWWGGLGHPDKWWYHNAKGALQGVTATSSLVFIALGAAAAYRQAARRGPRPPG